MASQYYVQKDGRNPIPIVARYRPLDVTFVQSSRNLGLLWVSDFRGVWLVLRSHAWYLGDMPPTIDWSSRDKVVRWAKTEIERWHSHQQASGWPGEGDWRKYFAWKEKVFDG
jgi:hypothetical protein